MTITIHNNENFKAWVDALATTTDKQVTNRLVDDTGHGFGFCCLGIGSKCMGLTFDAGDTEDLEELAFVVVRESKTYRYDAMPPTEFLTWLGVTPEDPTAVTGDVVIDWPERLVTRQCRSDEPGCNTWSDIPHMSELCWDESHDRFEYGNPDSGCYQGSMLNDSAGLSFSQIADVLRFFGVKDFGA